MTAVELIKKLEGLRLKAYPDDGGVWTVGYGTTKINGKPVTQGTIITEAEADKYLLDYLEKVALLFKSVIKVSLSDNQRTALTSFVYNIGSTRFKSSTMLPLLNSGEFAKAAKEFDRWILVRGKVNSILVKRRKKEKEIFLK